MMPLTIIAEIACYQSKKKPHVTGISFILCNENSKILQTYKRRIYHSSSLGETAALIESLNYAIVAASSHGAGQLLVRTDSTAIIYLCKNNARNLLHLQKKLSYFQISLDAQATLTSDLTNAMQLAKAATQHSTLQSSKHLTPLRC